MKNAKPTAIAGSVLVMGTVLAGPRDRSDGDTERRSGIWLKPSVTKRAIQESLPV